MSRRFQVEGGLSSRAKRLKQAVLASFNPEAEDVEVRLAGFELRDWLRILYWLDISGLALYLLDRIKQLGLEHCLPKPIRTRLEQNLIENGERTKALFEEAAAISAEMTRRNIGFALLKGITLTPDSVPDCRLRWQTDLDFLVAACDATEARHVLMTFGYGLHAVCGNTMEFSAGRPTAPDMGKIYRVHSQRSLELHMVSTSASRDGQRRDRLVRARRRNFGPTLIPALHPADVLVQQALHLFKHLCGEHTRASWVLEFRRHVEARRLDGMFWIEVERIAAQEAQGEIALGVAVLLSELVFGKLGQVPAADRSIEKLPRKVRLWVESFGRRVLLADSPGNKLYLILRKELRSDPEQRGAIRRLVFPAHFPPPVTRGARGERWAARLMRYRIELRHILVRLCFHVVEGVKYAIELSRWQRRVTEISQ
jgi:Uncharacterised nucleotidyltransferase